MKIKIWGNVGNYFADIEDLPGSPPIGKGVTKIEAVVNLALHVLNDTVYLPYIRGNTKINIYDECECINKKEVNISYDFQGRDTSFHIYLNNKEVYRTRDQRDRDLFMSELKMLAISKGLIISE